MVVSHLSSGPFFLPIHPSIPLFRPASGSEADIPSSVKRGSEAFLKAGGCSSNAVSLFPSAGSHPPIRIIFSQLNRGPPGKFNRANHPFIFSSTHPAALPSHLLTFSPSTLLPFFSIFNRQYSIVNGKPFSPSPLLLFSPSHLVP